MLTPTEVRELDLEYDILHVERTEGVHKCAHSGLSKFEIMIQDRPPTRRGDLSRVSSNSDPLGVLAPVVPKAKQVYEDSCRIVLESSGGNTADVNTLLDSLNDCTTTASYCPGA